MNAALDQTRFYCSLAISLLVHAGAIGYLSSSAAGVISRKPLKQIEVTYAALKTENEPQKNIQFKELNLLKEDKPIKNVKVLAQKSDIFSSIGNSIKDISKAARRLSLDKTQKKQTYQIAMRDMERKISIPIFKAEKMTNPRYLSYNENIRERIKQHAYMFVDHPDFQKGEVYLTFVLDANGTLKQTQIIKERTLANAYLQDVGVRSIEQSNPFPPFPADLSYPELTFNVVISFEVNRE